MSDRLPDAAFDRLLSVYMSAYGAALPHYHPGYAHDIACRACSSFLAYVERETPRLRRMDAVFGPAERDAEPAPAVATMHREDIKAAVNKAYGSMAAFERAHGLPRRSITDLLRGKASKRVELTVDEFLSRTENGQ